MSCLNRFRATHYTERKGNKIFDQQSDCVGVNERTTKIFPNANDRASICLCVAQARNFMSKIDRTRDSKIIIVEMSTRDQYKGSNEERITRE